MEKSQPNKFIYLQNILQNKTLTTVAFAESEAD